MLIILTIALILYIPAAIYVTYRAVKLTLDIAQRYTDEVKGELNDDR